MVVLDIGNGSQEEEDEDKGAENEPSAAGAAASASTTSRAAPTTAAGCAAARCPSPTRRRKWLSDSTRIPADTELAAAVAARDDAPALGSGAADSSLPHISQLVASYRAWMREHTVHTGGAAAAADELKEEEEEEEADDNDDDCGCDGLRVARPADFAHGRYAFFAAASVRKFTIGCHKRFTPVSLAKLGATRSSRCMSRGE